MRPPLYIHIPYCLQKCGYCDFFSKPSGSVPPEYVKAVSRQIEYLAREFCVEEWKSVYIGGGSPSLLSAKDLEFLCQSIKAAAPLAAKREWTIEMNPETVSRELLEAANARGINRLSVGIQCKNQKVLDAISRRATVAQIEEAASLIKNFWPHEWSADLIAGLPFQTKEDIARDIDFIERNGANHVSLYSLTLEEGTPLKSAIDAGKIPYDEEAAEELWLDGRDLLESRGFMQYEVSNFAKPGHESKHNSAYWALDSYLGAGAGAAGTIYGLPEGFRYTNVLDAATYIKFWNENKKPKGFTDQDARGGDCSQGHNVRAALGFPCQLEALDQDTQEFEYLMMNLRTRRGASAAEYKARYGGDLAARLDHVPKGVTGQNAGTATWLERTERDGDTFYAMTREGLLFLNRFLEEL